MPFHPICNNGVMAAIESWAKNESEELVRKKTAVAYAKYQNISVGSAERTFVEKVQ